jgi:hypothetical protein
MASRRDVLGSGLMGSVVGAFAGDAQPSGGDPDLAPVVRALNELRDAVRGQRTFSEIAALREAQMVFLRQNSKLPDFIDVGAGHWFAAYDWHIRWQQPLNIGRDAAGRLTLLLLSTQLVLRPEADRNFMSLPYENR